MNDEEILKERAKSYGTPKSSFTRIARLWSIYLDHNIQPYQVANMMSLLKISRTITAKGDTLIDSYQDGRNYLTLAEELHEI